MGMGSKFIKIGVGMMAIGKMTRLMGRDTFFSQMATHILAISIIIKPMDKENILVLNISLNMKETFLITNITDLEKKVGKMELNI